MEEFTTAMQEIYDATQEKGLTDEDLAKAAGGTGGDDTASLVVGSIFSASLIAYSAAEAASAAAGAAV